MSGTFVVLSRLRIGSVNLRTKRRKSRGILSLRGRTRTSERSADGAAVSVFPADADSGVTSTKSVATDACPRRGDPRSVVMTRSKARVVLRGIVSIVRIGSAVGVAFLKILRRDGDLDQRPRRRSDGLGAAGVRNGRIRISVSVFGRIHRSEASQREMIMRDARYFVVNEGDGDVLVGYRRQRRARRRRVQVRRVTRTIVSRLAPGLSRQKSFPPRTLRTGNSEDGVDASPSLDVTTDRLEDVRTVLRRNDDDGVESLRKNDRVDADSTGEMSQ